jgi:hypothetical protein
MFVIHTARAEEIGSFSISTAILSIDGTTSDMQVSMEKDML